MKDIFKPSYAVVMTLPYEGKDTHWFVKPGVVEGRIDTDVRATKEYRRKSYDDAVAMARQVRALVPTDLEFVCELYAGDDPRHVAAREAMTDAYAQVKFEVVSLEPVRHGEVY